MKRFLLLFSFFAACVFSFAQTRTEWLEYGDEAFKNKEYASAAFFYLKFLDKSSAESKNLAFPYDIKTWDKPQKSSQDGKVESEDSTSFKQEKKELNAAELRTQYVIHQIAESYRLASAYAHAEVWYRRSVEKNPDRFPDERYWYATTLMRNEKYNEAMKELEAYKNTKDPSSYEFHRADKNVLSCYYALDTTSIKKGFAVNVLDTNINSGTANFAPAFFGETKKLLFTSARKSNKHPAEKPDEAEYLCDLYTTIKTGNSWSSPESFTAPVNSELNDAAGSLSINKDLFFFTRWSGPDKKDCAIYVSKFLNGMWLQPMKLGPSVNTDGYQSMQPALSLEADKLYFASNKPGGFGKMDIWMATLDEFGNAGPAMNLGPKINTPEDEVAPFFHSLTTTLYFSSDGHTSLGGMDIHKAYASEDDTLWSTPINMARPVNSSRDEMYFILNQDQRLGYFSSDRFVCDGCSDEYCYKIFSLEKDPLVFTLKGKVYDSETNEPIPNALVTFKDIDGDLQPFYIITDETGAYSTMLRENIEYYLKSQKNKYFADAQTLSTKGLTESQDFVQDFFLGKIPAGDIVIPGIEYDYDKATLRPASMKILDELVDFLNLNNNISIEISSHTDTRGSDVYNMKLSQERAKSVVDYLISKGINSQRLVPQGYGETKVLVSDAEVAALKTQAAKEEAHQKNRRTAFRTTAEEEIRLQKK